MKILSNFKKLIIGGWGVRLFDTRELLPSVTLAVENFKKSLAVVRTMAGSYRNQCKSMGWFLHDENIGMTQIKPIRFRNKR